MADKIGKIGLIAGAFDPFPHVGIIWALRQAIESGQCDTIIAALHEDPSVERSWKRKPALPVDERKVLVEALRYVSRVVTYRTEAELIEVIRSVKPDIRILGDDYIGKAFTGDELCREMGIPVFYARRESGLSSTDITRRILTAEEDRVNRSMAYNET